MKIVKLYENKIPLKALYIIELIIGLILLLVFVFLFKNHIYLDIWTFAGPLLGIALIIAGLTGVKIKEINHNLSNKSIEINIESLFKLKSKQIDCSQMAVELKTANGKKNSLIPKLKLIFLEKNKEIEKLESGFLSMNNGKIRKLYSELKSILK